MKKTTAPAIENAHFNLISASLIEVQLLHTSTDTHATRTRYDSPEHKQRKAGQVVATIKGVLFGAEPVGYVLQFFAAPGRPTLPAAVFTTLPEAKDAARTKAAQRFEKMSFEAAAQVWSSDPAGPALPTWTRNEPEALKDARSKRVQTELRQEKAAAAAQVPTTRRSPAEVTPAQFAANEAATALSIDTAGIIYVINYHGPASADQLTQLTSGHPLSEASAAAEAARHADGMQRLKSGACPKCQAKDGEFCRLKGQPAGTVRLPHKARTEANAARPADPHAARHFHPTLTWQQLSPWQRKNYSHRTEAAAVPTGTAGTTSQLAFF